MSAGAKVVSVVGSVVTTLAVIGGVLYVVGGEDLAVEGTTYTAEVGGAGLGVSLGSLETGADSLVSGLNAARGKADAPKEEPPAEATSTRVR